MSKELKLTPRIEQIVSFYFNNPRMSYTDLGVQFGISVQRISAIMANPRVLNAYPVLAKRKIKSMVPRAIDRLGELMDQNFNMAVSEKIASKILDSEKVLEPATHKIIHELQLKSVKELQTIIEGAKAVPQQVFDGEIVVDVPSPE